MLFAFEAMLEVENVGADIDIEPPDPNLDSYEESGDKDEGGLANNLGLLPDNVRLGTTEAVPNDDQV